MKQNFEGAKPRLIFIDERISELIDALRAGFIHLGADEETPSAAIQWAEELVDRLKERNLKGKIRVEYGGDS